MYVSSGVHVHILLDTVEKRARGFIIPSQMASLAKRFTLERCQASVLLNAHVSLSFSLDGQLITLQVSSYTGRNQRTTKK